MSSTDVVRSGSAEIEQHTEAPVGFTLPAGVAPKPLQAGKIRAGEKAISKGGKQYPKALDRFRFTHPDREVIEAVAEVFGGQVSEWNDPKARPSRQWQVTTDANSIEVIVATSGSFSCVYEAWTEAGVSMRTDGTVNLITGALLDDPCPDDERGAKEWADRNGLKLTTRITVMPMDIPGLSEWMVETHGWISTATLADAAEKLMHFAHAGVSHVPARLTLSPAQGQVPVAPRDVEKARKAPKSHGYRQLGDGAWVGKSNFVLLGLDIATRTPREMFSLAEKAAAEIRELKATEMRELEAASSAQAHKGLHEVNTANPADPFDLDGGVIEPEALVEPSQVAALEQLVASTGTDLSKVLVHYQVAGLGDLTEVEAGELQAKLEERAQAGGAQ